MRFYLTLPSEKIVSDKRHLKNMTNNRYTKIVCRYELVFQIHSVLDIFLTILDLNLSPRLLYRRPYEEDVYMTKSRTRGSIRDPAKVVGSFTIFLRYLLKYPGTIVYTTIIKIYIQLTLCTCVSVHICVRILVRGFEILSVSL